MRLSLFPPIFTAVLLVLMTGWGGAVAESGKGDEPTPLVKLRMIVLKRGEDAKSVLSALDNGASFIKLAKDISAGPNADRGGHIGSVDVSRLKPPLRKALKGLRPGEYTGVVKTSMGYTIFQVTTDEHYNKGLELFDRERYEAALKELRKDLTLNPDSAFSYFYLGLSLHQLNRNRRAAEALEKSARLQPSLVETYYNLGRVYASMGSVRSAEEMYLKTLKMDPDFHLAYNNLAWLYAQYKIKIDEGIGYAKTAVGRAPAEAKYRHTLATLYLEAGKKDEAYAAMKSAVELAPHDEYYKDQLARLETIIAEKPVPRPGPATPGYAPARAEPKVVEERPASPEKKGVDPEAKRVNNLGLLIKVLNGNDVAGAAGAFAELLESMYYPVEEIGNAPSFGWVRTTILYRKGKFQEARDLARQIPGEQDLYRLRGHEPFHLVIIVGSK